jgi:DNA helicase MCM9
MSKEGGGLDAEETAQFEDLWEAAVTNGVPLALRNHIISRMCPKIYGMFAVKLAVSLALAGGVGYTDGSGAGCPPFIPVLP